MSITNLSFNFIVTLCMSSKFPINIFLVYIIFMKYIYGLMVLFLFARTMQSDSLFEWGSVCGWKHPEMCLSGRVPGVALSVWWVKTVKLSICITIYSHLPTPERIKSLWYCNLYQTIFNKFLWLMMSVWWVKTVKPSIYITIYFWLLVITNTIGVFIRASARQRSPKFSIPATQILGSAPEHSLCWTGLM